MATLQIEQVEGHEVYTSDGDKVGKVEDIYLDQASGQAEWVSVKAGFLGMKRMLVPIDGAQVDGDRVLLPCTREQLEQAPDIDETRLVSDDDERMMFDHYGLEYPGQSFERTGAADYADDDSVVRHEQELNVGKRTVSTGTARLRKWVETEPVSEAVELKQESATVRREAINEPASAGSIGAAEVEMPLTGEEAVVDKRTIAKERVSLDKNVERETEYVTDELRKEQVEVEDTDDSTFR